MKRLLALLLFGGLLFGAQGDVQKNKAPKKKEARFEVTTMEGQKLHFVITKNHVVCEEAKDKALILDFFGKHCPPCRRMIPVLGKIQKEMADKVLIVGLHVQEPLTPQEYAELKSMGITYPVVDMGANRENMLFVEYLGYATGWNSAIPYMLFFDRYGRYRANHYGIVSYDVLRQTIEQLTQPDQPKTPAKEPKERKKSGAYM